MVEEYSALEINLNGEIQNKSGIYSSYSEEELSILKTKLKFLFQDAALLQKKNSNLGNFLKMQIKTDKGRYEVMLGKELIKLIKYLK